MENEMKKILVYSIQTDDINSERRIISYSKTIFKKGKKPFLNQYENHFDNPFHVLEGDIKKHMIHGRTDKTVKWFNVTIKTSKGTFVQGYAREALNDR